MSMRPVSLIVLLTLLVGTLAAASVQSVPTVSLANDPTVPRTTPAQIEPTATIALAPIGTYVAGQPGAAEIVTHDPVAQVLYVINGATDEVDIVDISDPTAPTKTGTLNLTSFGAAPTSADFYSYGTDPGQGLLAVSVENANTQQPGRVVFFNRNGNAVRDVEVGELPDMVTFTPDGNNVLVANEGEPNADYTDDPEGSISIIEVDPATIGTTAPTINTAGFASFNAQFDTLRSDGVRIFGPNATVAQDLEPEYIAVAPDGQTAYVTLQENNAVAVVDIASATVTSIEPLGTKDYSLAENALDASDRDNTINITTWPVKGMYQPDAIATYQAGGMTYLVTANEGDARDYDGFSEEVRIEDLTLDTSVFTDAATLQAEANLGRLRVTNTLGDTDTDSAFEELYAYGARSFSIWNASGQLVYDSANEFEQITAAAYPDYFNANYDDEDNVFEFDARSDDKGPEPEGVTTGVIDGRTYAFIGLERIGGVMVYDVTDPNAPAFVQYINTANFTGSIVDGSAGDVSPEGLIFIPAADSPTGAPLLVVTHELSGTTTIFSITNPDGNTTLTLLHNNDGESSLLPIEYAVPPGTTNPMTVTLDVGGVAAFKTLTDDNIADARAAGNSVINVYAGDAFLASATLQCSLDNPTGPVYDAVAQRQISYDAHILGNHEFDYSPDFLERFIRDFSINGVLSQPFLGANLDFSAEPGFADLVDADGLVFDPITDGRVVAESLITTDELTGKRFGIVGVAPYYLETISSPRDVVVETTNLTSTATLIQSQVDRLYNDYGVRQIILVSHLQDIDEDKNLVPQLQRVDLVVAGGGDELLRNTTVPTVTQLLPGEEAPIAGDYPVEVQDADDRTVYIVTTAGNYKYLGRLDATFDANGEVTGFVAAESYPRRVIPTSQVATDLGLTDAVKPDAGIVSSVITPVEACLEDLADPLFGSEVLLDVSRNGVRGQETNAGNLITDSYLYAYNQLANENDLTVPITRVIAIQNGGGIRQNAGDQLPTSGVVPGTISRLDTKNVLAFFNTMTVVEEVTPAELKQIFERSVSRIGGGQFLQIAGMKIEYDPNNTAQVIETDGTVTTPGQRILNITLDDGTQIVSDGEVVSGAPNVAIITNSFTASGGDNYPWLENNTNKTQLFDENGVALTYEETWVRYLLNSTTDFPGTTIDPSMVTITSFTGPTIQDDDPRYQPGGAARITTEITLYMPIIAR